MEDNYELEERAAIRQLEGGQTKTAAELSARKEIKNQETKKSIKDLRAERDAIGSKMRAENNPAIKDKLFKKWMELSTQIIELGKEPKDGNDRRIS